MPLEILVVLVIGGIAGIALLTWALGWGTALRLGSAEQACIWWNREWPEIPARGAILAKDRHAAVIDTENGPGLVWVMGADCAARPLDQARVTATPTGINVHFPGMDVSDIHLHLDDPALAQRLAAKTQNLQKDTAAWVS